MRNKKMNMYGVNNNDRNNNSNIMINEFSELELYVADPNLNPKITMQMNSGDKVKLNSQYFIELHINYFALRQQLFQLKVYFRKQDILTVN